MPHLAAFPAGVVGSSVLLAAVLFAVLRSRRRLDDRFDAGWLAGYTARLH